DLRGRRVLDRDVLGLRRPGAVRRVSARARTLPPRACRVAAPRSRSGLAISGANETINLLGILGWRYALLLAPLSLVQAIASTTALVVFAIGAGLSVCCPALGREDLSSANLIRKAASAALVAAGAILINW